MIFLLTAHYPTNKAVEIGKKSLEAIKIKHPSYIKKWYMLSTLNGVKGYHLIVVEKGKVDEASVYISKILAPFSEIEGFRWKIEPLLEMTDTGELS
ncbi:MAG: hypothetical protein HWN67_12485 [Candidatus Helarchaeota archaeon]|nr:hypothetical protein [Candidatus Helarchaeota archaeon]